MIFRSLGCAFSVLGAGALVVAGCSDTPAEQAPGGFGTAGSNATAGTTASAGSAGMAGSGSGGQGTAGSATGGVGTAGSAPLAGSGGAGGSVSGGSGGSAPGEYTVPTVTWPSAECTAKADEILAQMTNAEKAAQMVMGQNPSTNLVTSTSLGTVFCGGTLTPPGGSKASDWAGMIDGYVAAAADSRL